MIRFHIVWQQDMLDALASIWLDAPDRGAVSNAADAIEGELKFNPKSKGIDFGDGVYGVEIGVLYVLYEVVDQDHFVRIVGIASVNAP